MSVRESVTLAACKVIASKCGLDDSEIMDALTDFMESRFAENTSCVEVNQPIQSTIMLSPGKYSKKSLIGGEKMGVSGAYVGKRDGIIVECKDERGVAYEFPASTAESVLSGYEALVSDFVNSYGMITDAQDMADAREKATKIENEAHLAATQETRMRDLRFGSW